MIWLYIALGLWLALATVGQAVLYIGYGFVQSARTAVAGGQQQAVVVKVDSSIAICFVVLDAVSNLLVYSVVMLDFRPRVMFHQVTYKGRQIWLPELVTGRFCQYSLNLKERAFRRWFAAVLGAFLNGKDKDHIKGVTERFAWLD